MAEKLQVIRTLLETNELAPLGPGPRPGVKDISELNGLLERAFSSASISLRGQALVRSLVLLWHDHLDAAHSIAQDIENADGSFVHGIMHRREPDYSNAGYWFRRVGKHPAFDELAARVGAFFEANPHQGLQSRLLPKGNWDPFAFIDACEAASRKSAALEDWKRLEQIQAIETATLIDHFTRN